MSSLYVIWILPALAVPPYSRSSSRNLGALRVSSAREFASPAAHVLESLPRLTMLRCGPVLQIALLVGTSATRDTESRLPGGAGAAGTSNDPAAPLLAVQVESNGSFVILAGNEPQFSHSPDDAWLKCATARLYALRHNGRTDRERFLLA